MFLVGYVFGNVFWGCVAGVSCVCQAQRNAWVSAHLAAWQLQRDLRPFLRLRAVCFDASDAFCALMREPIPRTRFNENGCGPGSGCHLPWWGWHSRFSKW